MTMALAVTAGIGVFLSVGRVRRRSIAQQAERYLRPHVESVRRPKLRPAVDLRAAGAAAAGALAGLLAAQGDLFVAGPGRSAPALAVLGGLAGWLLLRMQASTRRQRDARSLRFELPPVAEALALHILAGESVGNAISRFVSDASGVAARELAAVVRDVEAGDGWAEALLAASRVTADADGARLYSALAHAHNVGGRLADTLHDLAKDYRASLAREMTREGGRRAVATYGPVLGLMVPVTLLFLLYPTIEGLRELAP